jgi:hypothetical protein
MKKIHLLLAVQSLVAILVSINRLGTWTLGYVLPNEFLRWVDFNNMLILPLISVIASYLLKKTMEYDSPKREGKAHIAWNLVFIVGLYLLAASYGDHEVTNYLHQRFCESDTAGAWCGIVIFNDDQFSHLVFFTGFVLINTALLFLQTVFPYREQLTTGDTSLLVGNAVFLAAGIFANLGFEEIGLDLYVVALLAFLSVYLLWRRGKQPLFIYYTAAYWLGLIASFVAQAMR